MPYQTKKMHFAVAGASLSKGQRMCHLARERFFLGGLLLLKKLLFDFRRTVWRNFQPYIFCHTYSNLIVFLRGVETDGIILLVENSVLSYTCGGLHEGHIFWIYTSKQSITISWGYRGVLEG